jgi:hypothetical protein
MHTVAMVIWLIVAAGQGLLLFTAAIKMLGDR